MIRALSEEAAAWVHEAVCMTLSVGVPAFVVFACWVLMGE